jgi:hypothetical protein
MAVDAAAATGSLRTLGTGATQAAAGNDARFANPAVVSALPGSPVDGQEVYFNADAANGVKWHLRYNAGSASAYKWEFIGGSALHAAVDAGEGTTSATYTDLATVGPSITLPLAGDYDVEAGAQLWNSAAGNDALMSYQIGATAAVDLDGIMNRAAAANAPLVHLVQTRRKTGLAASTALVAKYKAVGGGGVGSFQVRRLRAIPVRVG